MRMYDIIEKKKRGLSLNDDEVLFVINGYTDGNIPDYQMSAFLMAVYFNGMTDRELYNFTMAMRDSGDILDLKGIKGPKIDKHSTGGVGDKTTLIVGPVVAAAGALVAKMSGRGLGHTGGTIDKLESIPGFKTELSEDKFISQVNNIGIAVAGQTANLAPADKKIYALRDVTAVVDSIPLIASSIMSKKLASGADGIVLDVKCGSGAFMKNKDDAEVLARDMVMIGKNKGKKMCALITDMNEPLGKYVGNALEVYEAVMCLKGEGELRLMELCYDLSAYMLVLSTIAESYEMGVEIAKEMISSGKALKVFEKFVESQGGDTEYIHNCEKLINTRYKENVTCSAGYVKDINAELIGKACQILGGGREKKGDDIDPSVGIYINKKTGDYCNENDYVCTVYGNDIKKVADACETIKKAYTISENKSEKNPVIYKVIM